MRKFLPFILLVIVGERASGRKKVFIWRFLIHNRLIIFLGLHLGKSSKVAKINLVSSKGFSRGINLCLFGVFAFTIVLLRTKGKEKGTGSWAQDWPSLPFFGELNDNGRERQIDQQFPHNSIQY